MLDRNPSYWAGSALSDAIAADQGRRADVLPGAVADYPRTLTPASAFCQQWPQGADFVRQVLAECGGDEDAAAATLRLDALTDGRVGPVAIRDLKAGLGRCPECNGDTIRFRGTGSSSTFKLCSRRHEAGHLGLVDVQERIEALDMSEVSP